MEGHMENKTHVLIIFIVGVLLLNQYFTGSIPGDGDAKTHLMNAWFYERHIEEYRAIPQWESSWYGGYPISLNMLLPYLTVGLLAAAFKFAGIAFWYKAVFALSVIFSSILLYLIAREYGISDEAALVGALLFITNPRVLTNVFVYGHFTTFFGIAFFLLMVYNIKRGRTFLASISFAAVLLSHLETSLAAGLFLGGMFLSELFSKNYRDLAIPVSVGAFGLLFSSFRLIPVIGWILQGVQNLEGIKEPISPWNLFLFRNSQEWPGVGPVLAVLALLGLLLSFRKSKMRDMTAYALIMLFVATTIGYTVLNNPLTEFAFTKFYHHPLSERNTLFLALPLVLLAAYAVDVLMYKKLSLNIGGTRISAERLWLLAAAFMLVGSAYYLVGFADLVTRAQPHLWAPSDSPEEVILYFKNSTAKVFVGEGFNAAGAFDKFFPMFTGARVFQGFSPEDAINFQYINALYSDRYIQFAYAGGAEYFVINKDNTATIVPYYGILQEFLKGNPKGITKVLENKDYVVYKVEDPVPFISANIPVSYRTITPERIELALSKCTSEYNLTILQAFSPEWQASKGRLSQTPLQFTSLYGKCERTEEAITLEFRHKYYFWVTGIGILLAVLYFGYAEKRLLGKNAQGAV